MPHGIHIYAKESDMENATMCAYPHSDHALPHWKYVLHVVVINVHVSIFLTKKQMKNMKKQHPQLGFTFITPLHVVLLMV